MERTESDQQKAKGGAAKETAKGREHDGLEKSRHGNPGRKSCVGNEWLCVPDDSKPELVVEGHLGASLRDSGVVTCPQLYK